jgi:hypothetical protein
MTVNVAVCPTVTVWLGGCWVIIGATLAPGPPGGVPLGGGHELIPSTVTRERSTLSLSITGSSSRISSWTQCEFSALI